MSKFDLSDVRYGSDDARLALELARIAIDTAEQAGAPARRVAELRDTARRMELRGADLVEVEEPLIAHGAGPAAPRRVRRNAYLKVHRQ